MSNPSKKNRIPDEAKLGGVFVLAILVFVFGLFFLKDYRITGGTYELKAKFENLSGIKNKDPVLFGGVKVGMVIGVGFEDHAPYAIMRIYDEFTVPVDSKVQVISRSMLGELGLEIKRGTSTTMAQEGSVLEGMGALGLDSVIGKADSLSGGLQSLLTNVNRLFGDDLDRSLLGSLNNVEALTGEMRVTLRQEQSRINRTLSNLDSLLNTAKEISVSEREKISATMGNMRKASARLDAMILEFQGVSSSLAAIMQKIERGDGTLGKLVNDDKLYTDMNRLMVNLDGLVSDLKENPKRYLNVSIF